MEGKSPTLTRLQFLTAPLLLAFVCGALLLARLACPLLEPEEARYAEIPRQMLAEGRVLINVVAGGDPSGVPEPASGRIQHGSGRRREHEPFARGNHRSQQSACDGSGRPLQGF